MPPWQDGILNSGLMGREMPYRVLLPQKHGSSGLRYPVLYLLHGLFGSFENWTALTDIASVPGTHQLIVVMPEGENGWYTDGVSVHDKYESWLLRELLPAIDSGFDTIAERDGRAVAGLSMGGYGAFKLALKFPEIFEFAASISGAFEVTRWSDMHPTQDWDLFGPPINRIFGEPASLVRTENELNGLISGISETGIARLPYLYFDCGADDAFISANRRLDARLTDAGVAHEFHKQPGGHDWEYWNSRGESLIELAVSRLAGFR